MDEKSVRPRLEYVALVAAILIPVLLMHVVLQYQVDPFDSATVISAKLISQLGSVGASHSYLQSQTQYTVPISPPGWTWQQDTETVLSFIYGSGMLLAILHLVTGGPLVVLSYIPVPYFVMVLGTFLIAKYIWKGVSRSKRLPSVIFLAIASLGIYSEIANQLLGNGLNGLEFHAVNNAFLVLFYYLLLRGINENKVGKYTLPLVILFSAIVTVHYTVPLLIVGGLAAYLFIVIITGGLRSSNRGQIRDLATLLVPLAVLASLQSYYYAVLGGLNFSFTGQRLVAYITGEFAQLGFIAPSVQTVYYLLLTKSYSLLMTALVLAVTLIYVFRGQLQGTFGRSTPYFLFAAVVGASITYSVLYFSYYGGLNFGYQTPWLLQLLLVPTLMAVAEIRKKSLQHLYTILVIVLISLAIINAASSSLYVITQTTQGPYAPEIGSDSSQVLGFLTTGNSTNQYLIGGSVGATSMVYRQLADYPVVRVLQIILIPLGGYVQYYHSGGAASMYAGLSSTLNFLVVTRYEMGNGLYGDVGPSYGGASTYLGPIQLSNVTTVLNSKINVIYDSNIAILYSWGNRS